MRVKVVPDCLRIVTPTIVRARGGVIPYHPVAMYLSSGLSGLDLMKAKKKQKKKTTVVARTKRGPVRVRVRAKATREERAETVVFVETLDANAQIAHGKTLTPGTTHQVKTDSRGKKVLIRRRYSAI